jgi:hypothetical protein
MKSRAWAKLGVEQVETENREANASTCLGPKGSFEEIYLQEFSVGRDRRQ